LPSVINDIDINSLKFKNTVKGIKTKASEDLTLMCIQTLKPNQHATVSKLLINRANAKITDIAVI
jgi:hypothetical protein